MTNALILCGGTGAHVALALTRLHTLGYALGFYRQQNGTPLDFPTLYLVDQDSGDGIEQDTAWQVVRRLIDAHPARYDWHKAIGRRERPSLELVTPLPVGEDRKWFAPPYDSLGSRFANTPYLEPLTAQGQRDILFSRGMMGSPAVGSLLFELKKYDERPNGLNLDETFDQLLKERGRIVVAGSGVGGTGAAVGPTLAQQFSKTDAEVMAVMVLNWFRFGLEGLDEETREKAQLRNRVMLENANSAFQYSGQNLAESVATVPIGMPDGALIDRRYTSDMQQPTRESFAHGVAALCCLRHFLNPEPYGAGLYQMGAEDPTKLGGGNSIPGGTLQSLANQAATLADTLDVFAAVLRVSHSGSRVDPAIYGAVAALVADPRQVAESVGALVGDYREHLAWMRDVLGVEAQPNRDLTLEVSGRKRLIEEGRAITDKTDLSPEDVGLALFHWTADWIRDFRTVENGLVRASGTVKGGYWPELLGEGLTVAAESAGELTRVPDQNIQGTLEGFVDPAYVSANGWPDPVAAADHFRYAIRHDDRTAKRQLEMLLVGLVTEELKLREIPSMDKEPTGVSLERLVSEFRKERLPEFARVAVVYPRTDGEVVLGFNSPHTLLCPVPLLSSDKQAKLIWGELWAKLTGSIETKDWATEEEPETWLNSDLPVRQVRFWLATLKRVQPGTAPPWTQLFEGQPTSSPVPIGTGRTLSVNWDPGTSERLVEIALPKKDSGNFRPTPDNPRIDVQDLLARVPELQAFHDEDGRTLFEMVTFQVPERAEPVRGVWKEHLERLQGLGKIAAFGAADDQVFIGILSSETVMQAAILENTWLLDRSSMMVQSCFPMRQDPVPGPPKGLGEVLYPDLPLRSDYVGLVQTEAGENILDLLKAGKKLSGGTLQPRVADGRQGEKSALWTLRLKGRSEPLPITLPVPADSNSLHQAHWMVWPRFRSGREPFWRAYYIYENCTNPRVHIETLWLDPDSDRIRRCGTPDPKVFGSHPIGFRTGDRRAHTGGPPVAVSARDIGSGEEAGLYLVWLDSLPTREEDVKVGIDFGTSHTVASAMVGERRTLVDLAPELDPDNVERALTFHISENWSHVDAPFEKEGLLSMAVWLPTYAKSVAHDAEGLIPSELMTIRPLDKLKAENIDEWQPGHDYVIPPMDMARHDLADRILADFKWETSFSSFRRQEPVLRELYLGMVLELVMADVVWKLGALPTRRVDLTFTYPLRTQEKDVESYKATLRRVIESGSSSLGCKLGLTDGEGIYDESRAARGGTANFGEVSLVGDLGGGTLDLFIGAYDGPGVKFDNVADSVRLGGNLLLRKLAENPRRFLPEDGGWDSRSAQSRETQLRAWMRSMGSHRLFGPRASSRPRHDGLDLSGFDRPAQAAEAGRLIQRYFRLVVEYMARSLVAFLALHWYEKVKKPQHAKLKILLQLRGNGWRLWHESPEYSRIEQEIGKRIEERTRALWAELDEPPAGAPGDNRWQTGGAEEGNPKVAPILEVVGKSMPYEKVRDSWYTHTLVDLQLLRSDQSSHKVPWFQRLPFRTGGEGTRIEFDRISPPFHLSNPDAEKQVILRDLEVPLKRRINRTLQDDKTFEGEGLDFRAPVAPLVWEAAFDSKVFLGKS